MSSLPENSPTRKEHWFYIWKEIGGQCNQNIPDNIKELEEILPVIMKEKHRRFSDDNIPLASTENMF